MTWWRGRSGVTRGAMRGREAVAITVAVCVVLLSGCGLSVPSDPKGTLDRVSGGTLRVGVSPDPPLAVAQGQEPSGAMIDLASGFADSVGANARWTVGSEETLVGLLEDGDLDLVVGGLTDQTPWVDKAGATRGYTGIPGADGRSIVMLVPLGENAMLASLESFVPRRRGRAMKAMKKGNIGRIDLPQAQQTALRKAVRWEIFTICYTVGTITLVGFVMGNSQAA